MQSSDETTTALGSRAVAIARGWIGTPYHHQASIKGAGTDCLGLVRGVYREIYGREAQTPPPYAPDWAEACGHEAMLEAATRHLTAVPTDVMRPGDILVFRLRAGMVAKHAGVLATRDTFIHAMEGVAVSEVAFSAWWQRRVAGVFRFSGA